VSDVDLRHLRSFLAVAEEASITRAAARMYLTQQALSRQIQVLERSLGATLLVRTSRGVMLTAAGEELAAGGKALTADVDALAQRVRAAARTQSGGLRWRAARHGRGNLRDGGGLAASRPHGPGRGAGGSGPFARHAVAAVAVLVDE
jgi:DNA-binding transcriptional LysR family regulator